MKTYTVKLYYSTFCTHTLQAESEEEALDKACKITIDGNTDVINELITNLDPMDGAEAEEET
jgi:hypothetical protein